MSILLGGTLFGLYAGYLALLTSPLFQIKEIRWIGLERLKGSAMAKRYHWVYGRNIFLLDLAQIQERVLADPWVNGTILRRDFPDRLTIVITERKPAAVEIDASGRETLLDEEGISLERGGPYPPELPRLIHFNRESYPKALLLAGLLSDHSLVAINLSNPDDLIARLEEGTLHFGGEGYRERWRRFLEIEGDLQRRGLYDWEIDLRFPDKIIVKTGLPKKQEVQRKKADRVQF